MSENREEILANFQALTGIDDVAQAIFVLEENDWDLLVAANKMIPMEQSFQDIPQDVVDLVTDVMEVPARPVESANNTPMVTNHMEKEVMNSFAASSSNSSSSSSSNNSSTNHMNSMPSTSASSGPKLMRFNIQYCGKVVSFDVPDTDTVNDLKILLQKKFKVSPCRQILSNWATPAKYQSTPFKTLLLPEINSLQLTVKTTDTGLTAEDDNKVTERLNGIFNLSISDGKKTYTVQFPGTKTILDVKAGVFSCTDIPVRNQLWSGWPPNIDDDTVLALSGIGFPNHELSVRPNPSITNSRQKKPDDEVIQLDSDEEFEDASETFTVDDDYFVDNVSSKRVEPLIPKDVEDEIIGSITFSEQFHSRYAINTTFYQGTLDDAIKQACNRPATERKLMGIYLHHDASVLSNVFCSQLLGFESVIQLLNTNFVLWGWDLTFETNRNRLQNSVHNNLGAAAATSLKNIPVDRLPAIIIIMKIRSTTEIFSIVYGNVGVNELLSSLLEAVEVFKEHQDVEIREERERAEREQVKWEQDLAYNESLLADKAKEETKRMLEEAETMERKRVETARAEVYAKKEAHRKQVEASLPPEPPVQDQGDHITKIRFKLPEGENIERRFVVQTPLKVLLDYLIVQGYPTEEFKVISSWPRRDLTTIDCTQSLHDLKLYPQETLMLEER